jgi:Tfp pilus assembly protein PilF
MNSSKQARFLFALALAAALLSACTRDPQILKKKHFDKGQAYFQQAKYPEAAIEFRNAIQFDSKYADAHYQARPNIFEGSRLGPRLPGTDAYRRTQS